MTTHLEAKSRHRVCPQTGNNKLPSEAFYSEPAISFIVNTSFITLCVNDYCHCSMELITLWHIYCRANTRRMKRRENQFLTMKEYGSFIFARNLIFYTYTGKGSCKVDTPFVFCYLLNYACSVLCSDQFKSENLK